MLEGALKSFVKDPHGVRLEQISAIRSELDKLVSNIGYRKILTDSQIDSLLADFEWRKKMLPEVEANWRAVRRIPLAI